LPTARERIAGTLDASGTIYAIGGVVDTTLSSEVDAFTPGQPAWTAAASLPTARGYIAATTDEGGHVWAFGGGDGTGSAVDETDTLGTAGWTQPTQLPQARSNATAARAEDLLYVIGGRVNAAITSSVVGYLPATNVWQTLPSLAESRSDLCAAVGGDSRVYAIGGYDGDGGLTVVEAAREGAQWVVAAQLTMARDSCFAAAGPDGRIFAFGGRDTPTVATGTTAAEAYGPVLALGATSGSAGDTLAVNGSNFAANANVIIAFDGVPFERATTDASGNLATITIHVPALAAGGYQVSATDDHSLYRVSLSFTIE
jgi:N-acetylneuraminic acid mutarotase